MTQHQRLLIIDFGSQVTQLIARRLRELNVYCEIHPFNAVDDAFLKDFAPQAVILSGGPASVTQAGSPRCPQAVFDMGVPVFGICYGFQAMAQAEAEIAAGGFLRPDPLSPLAEAEHQLLVDVAAEVGPALRLPAGTARRRVEDAVLLAEMLPEVLTALEEGRIGSPQAAGAGRAVA